MKNSLIFVKKAKKVQSSEFRVLSFFIIFADYKI